MGFLFSFTKNLWHAQSLTASPTNNGTNATPTDHAHVAHVLAKERMAPFLCMHNIKLQKLNFFGSVGSTEQLNKLKCPKFTDTVHILNLVIIILIVL